MRSKIENEKLVAYLEGRIDSGNAPQVQGELDALLAEDPGRELVIDASDLAFISSAGLRVLLQASKKLGKPLTVREVSLEVYEILEMTGFTDLLDVKKKLREFSVEGCEVIGKGAIGTVYRVDADTIVKVYEIPDSLPMIENEQKRAKLAFLKGIPTAISYDVVKVGDKYGSVFELLRASTYNDVVIEHPERLDDIVRQYARFMREMHTVEMDAGELPEAKAVFMEYLDGLKDILGDALYGRLKALFEAMPQDDHVVHGDIQMKNIMLSGDEPLLIDMDTLSVGDPVFDLMGIYVTYVLFNEDDPMNTEEFLGLSRETCDFIWEKTMEYYFDDRDEATRAAAIRKVRIVGCVRFLFLVALLNIGKPELKQIRIDHALKHLNELANEVDSLAVRE